MLAIYERELKAYFHSMTAYIFLGLFMLVVGYYYWYCCVFYGMNDFGYYVLDSVTYVFFLVPVLTMRVFAAERKNKTDQLIMTAPVSSIEIVLGKYLAVFSLFMVGVAMTLIFPILIAIYGEVMLPELLSSYLGFILFGAALIAIGVFVSVLFDNQIVVAIISIVVFLFIFLFDTLCSALPASTPFTFAFFILLTLGVAGVFAYETKKWQPAAIVAVLGFAATYGGYLIKPTWYKNGAVTVLSDISICARYDEFSSNLVNLSTIVYLFSVTVIFVLLTTQVIRRRRWR